MRLSGDHRRWTAQKIEVTFQPTDDKPPQPHRHYFTAMTLSAALNQKAKAILIRELGPVDYARFIQQYEEGTGDYTRDRHQWLGDESARTLHEQATILAANGELPRPAGKKLISEEG